MPWFPRPVGPRAAVADLRAFMRSAGREKAIGGLLALLVTGIIVFEFLIDSRINTSTAPRVIYAESWSANRTDAEIVADQKKDQAARDAALKARQRQFQKIEKQLGIE